jgi:predicted metalloprotease with PDZ domain
MRFIRPMLGASLLLSAWSAFAAPVTSLRIDLTPILDKARPALQVDVRYRPGSGGQCAIELPNEWADQQAMYKAVHNLRLVGSAAQLRETDKPHVRSFDCKRNQPVHLRYELRQEDEAPLNNARRYRFSMDSAHFHLIGYAGWVLPKAEEEDQLKVDLRWASMPSAWVLANSFGAEMKRQTVSASFDRFRASVFVGGDFRLHRMKDEAGRGVTVAMRGNWSFSDQDFASKARSIIGAERDFWSSKESAYLVTLIPLSEPPGSKSLGGTSLTSAFATFLTPNAELGELSTLLAHEYFHNWNSRQLGTMAEPQQSVYWISEGFTDYYAPLLLLRSGQMTLDAYIAQCNALLKNVYMSPVREADNLHVIEAFWKDQNVQKLPYNRGALLAMEWQAQIHAASGGRKSFDDLMYGLRQQSAAAERSGGKAPVLDAARVAAILDQLGATGAASLVQRHIDAGKLIVPRGEWLGPAVELQQIELPVFELGLDLAKLKEKVIDGVAEGSQPYAAGLRNGQRVIKRTPIYLGNTEQTIEVTVEADGGQQTYRFQPRAAKGLTVPQFRLRPDATPAQLAQTKQLLGIPNR